MSFTLTGSTDIYVKYFQPSYDGYLVYDSDTGLYTTDFDSTTIKIGYVDASHTYNRGFIEWDTSILESGINVIELALLCETTRETNARDSQIREILGARPKDFYDGSITDGELFAEIGEGTIYYNTAGFMINGAYNQYIDLGTSAETDFETNLTNGWFGIGIQSTNEAYVNYLVISKMLSSENVLSRPMPTLKVSYRLNGSATVTLDDPINIRITTGAALGKFNFRDGYYKIYSRGKEKDYLVIEGEEITTGEDKVQKIRNYIALGYKMAVSGLSDTNLNTDYYIKDINAEKHEGYCSGRYRYTLTLERI